MKRKLALAALAALAVLTSGFLIPASGTAATPTGPFAAQLRARVTYAVTHHGITAQQGNEILRNPALLWTKYTTANPPRQLPASTGPTVMSPQMLVASCRQSSRWIWTFNTAGIEAGGVATQMYWCYNGWSVTSYSGYCSTFITGWGSWNNWRGSCQEGWIMYTLNGHYNGGVHHIARGEFVASAWPVNFYATRQIDMWGHYDGSCDTLYGGTLRNYC